MRTPITLITLLALVPACAGQGAGLIGSNGLEPVVTVDGVIVGQPSTLRVTGLVAQPMPSLRLLIGTEPASISMGGVWPGAIIGVNPAPAPGGTFLLSPSLPVPPSGIVSVSFVPPPAFLGLTFYIQALNLDPLAAPAGVALSDTIAATYGNTDVRVVASTGPDAENQTLLELFADGSAQGGTLPAHPAIEIQDLELTASNDTLSLANDHPVVDRSDSDRPRILLPGGAALYMFEKDSGIEGFFLVRPGAVAPELLIEAQGEFDSEVGASPFEPLIAVMAGDPLPAFRGARLFLIRTDGQNWPGTASRLKAIPTGSIDVDHDSLTFVQGALFYNDGRLLFRQPTDLSSGPVQIPLPPTGGAGPNVMDSEMAWSESGNAIAFTAGSGPLVRDVYVVSATGSALNVTAAPGIYSSVGYGDPLLGGRLALAPDGSRVAFLREQNLELDLYVQDTQLGLAGGPPVLPPSNVTGPAQFTPYIEAEAGIWMVAPDRVVFHAGHWADKKDIYEVSLPNGVGGPVLVSNVTLSSGQPYPPYGLGSSLLVTGRGRLPGGGVLYQLTQGPGTPAKFVGVPTLQGHPTVLLTGVTNLVGAQPSEAGTVIAYDKASGGGVLLLDQAGVSINLLTTAPGQAPSAIVTDPLSDRVVALFDNGGLQTASLLSTAGSPLPVGGLSAPALRRGASFLLDGRILLGAEGNGTAAQVHAVDPLTGQATLLTTLGTTVLFY